MADETAGMGALQTLTARVRSLSSLSQRLIVIITLLPVFLLTIHLGGWVYYSVLIICLSIATWELWRIFNTGGFRPSVTGMVGGSALVVLARAVWGFEHAGGLLVLLIFGAMSFAIFNYHKFERTAAVDFTITLGGILYIGWLGSYLISLRTLPNGEWWLLTVLPASWLGDGGAYLVGSRIGKHRMAEHISPKKTWEGYIAGVVFATLGTAGLGALWHMIAPEITFFNGLVIGAAISLITPLGDLGESVLKRGFGVKDSGTLLPGHGGILDRIDSWLWAAPIGFYLILYLFT